MDSHVWPAADSGRFFFSSAVLLGLVGTVVAAQGKLLVKFLCVVALVRRLMSVILLLPNCIPICLRRGLV